MTTIFWYISTEKFVKLLTLWIGRIKARFITTNWCISVSNFQQKFSTKSFIRMKYLPSWRNLFLFTCIRFHFQETHIILFLIPIQNSIRGSKSSLLEEGIFLQNISWTPSEQQDLPCRAMLIASNCSAGYLKVILFAKSAGLGMEFMVDTLFLKDLIYG